MLLTVTFLVLAWGEFAESDGITNLGGYLGLLTALAAWYASFAGVTAFTWAPDRPGRSARVAIRPIPRSRTNADPTRRT